MKLFKSKKGFNDTYMFWVIILILLGTSALLTFADDSFALSNQSNINVKDIGSEAQQETTSAGIIQTSINFIIILFRLMTLDIGNLLNLPLILDLFYFSISMVGVFIGARLIRGTG